MALRHDHDAHGRPEGYAAPRHHADDARQLHDQFQGSQDLYRVRRVRPDQGSAEGVLHLAADEEETHHHPARAGNLRSVARYAEGEYHLCAQFRQRDLRQQRGQPPLLDALRLFDRTRNRLDGAVGLYGRRLQGRQREQELHLLLHRRLGSRTQGVRFDAVQLQAAGHRPCRDQRHFPGAEPQTGSLPRLRLPGYQRQPDVRTVDRQGGFSGQSDQPRADARLFGLVRLAAPLRHGRSAGLHADVHRRGLQTADAPAVGTSRTAQGHALFRRRASRSHRPAVRQHPRRAGHLGSPDRGARYGGPVVRRALGLASRYDQGRDHLFQTRYGQQVAGGDRTAETRMAVYREQVGGEGARKARTRAQTRRSGRRGVGGAGKAQPLQGQPLDHGRRESARQPQIGVRLSAAQTRFRGRAAHLYH